MSVALRDGGRIDDCQLISIGRNRAGSVWVLSDGMDAFVRATDIVDMWEAVGTNEKAA